ncbi:MAG: type VI secretion system baseplate subunit TssE, partial [Verrucomicrobiia bacterium]
PRLVKDKLKVEIVDTRMLKAEDKHKLMFEITGELWANPMPEQFMARTEFDVENGHCRLVRV